MHAIGDDDEWTLVSSPPPARTPGRVREWQFGTALSRPDDDGTPETARGWALCRPVSGMRTATRRAAPVVTCTTNRRRPSRSHQDQVGSTDGGRGAMPSTHPLFAYAERGRGRVFREKGNARQGGDRRARARGRQRFR
jgi:hypothetical protein